MFIVTLPYTSFDIALNLSADSSVSAFHNSKQNPAIEPQSLIDANMGLYIKQNSMQLIQQERFNPRKHRRLDYSEITGSVDWSGNIGTLKAGDRCRKARLPDPEYTIVTGEVMVYLRPAEKPRPESRPESQE
jgi:hypothetical protein